MEGRTRALGGPQETPSRCSSCARRALPVASKGLGDVGLPKKPHPNAREKEKS